MGREELNNYLDEILSGADLERYKEKVFFESEMGFQGDLAMKAYSRGDIEYFENCDKKYQIARERLANLDTDLSKFPETLEELIK